MQIHCKIIQFGTKEKKKSIASSLNLFYAVICRNYFIIIIFIIILMSFSIILYTAIIIGSILPVCKSLTGNKWHRSSESCPCKYNILSRRGTAPAGTTGSAVRGSGAMLRVQLAPGRLTETRGQPSLND